MKSPTVEQLGQQIEELQNDVYEVIPKANESYQYDLSASQKVCIFYGRSILKTQCITFHFLWRLSSELNVMHKRECIIC